MPPVIDKQICNGCGQCEMYCPGDLIVLEGEAKVLKRAFVKYPEECWHCGICRLECPVGAVSYRFPDAMVG